MTIAEKSWPPSHAPPPGETDCSMMAIFRLRFTLVSSHAHARPALPAPEMITSDSAKSCKSFMYRLDISLLTVDSLIGAKICGGDVEVK